jgi:hypothetical protein
MDAQAVHLTLGRPGESLRLWCNASSMLFKLQRVRHMRIAR